MPATSLQRRLVSVALTINLVAAALAVFNFSAAIAAAVVAVALPAGFPLLRWDDAMRFRRASLATAGFYAALVVPLSLVGGLLLVPTCLILCAAGLAPTEARSGGLAGRMAQHLVVLAVAAGALALLVWMIDSVLSSG